MLQLKMCNLLLTQRLLTFTGISSLINTENDQLWGGYRLTPPLAFMLIQFSGNKDWDL